MIPPPFDYHAPKTLPEAIALLGKLGEEAKILSGGQSLLPLLKLRFASPGHLIDIGRIPGLDYIKEEGGFLRIGALVREAALESSDLITSQYPILRDTARSIADPIVRNLATVCGNLAHGDPANDHPATMLALGASVILTGPTGTREVPVASFFTGIFTTALEAERGADRDPHPGPAGRLGRRVPEARAQGRRLRDRGSGRVPGDEGRRDRAGRHRHHERGAHAHQGHRGGEVRSWASSRTRRPSLKPASSPRPRPRPTRIGAARPTTGKTWCGC